VRVESPHKATRELLPYVVRSLSKGNYLKMTKLKEEFFKILPPTIFFSSRRISSRLSAS